MINGPLSCKKCGNSDQSMLELVGTNGVNVLVYCLVCSKSSYYSTGESKEQEDVREGDSKDKL
jgi:hypothetical protein